MHASARHDKAAFTVTRPKVDAEFEYRVACGGLTSEWFGVSVVDPVEVDEANSCVRLGKQYEEGRGVSRDEDRAIALYRKACLVGNNAACHLPLLLRRAERLANPQTRKAAKAKQSFAQDQRDASRQNW